MVERACAAVLSLGGRSEQNADTLRIGGFVPLSSVDYPGMLAAVVFCQGCPWSCRYCHNPHLLPARGEMEIPWASIREFLYRRQGLLDAVVFSGGEPSYQKALLPALQETRGLGFNTAVHTGGAYPDKLVELLPWLDWVGFDVKTPVEDYPGLTGVAGSGERNWRSLMLLLASGVSYEVRTSWHTDLMSPKDLQVLANRLAEVGVMNYSIQVVRGGELHEPGLATSPWNGEYRDFVHREIAPLFDRFNLREG